jgi:hypothetical protein
MERLAFVVPDWVIPRWVKVAYLIINWRVKDLADRIQLSPEARFYDVMAKHLRAYVQDGVMPPADIAPAILNLADDYMNGREMNLRAGDYIAIQNHLRAGK